MTDRAKVIADLEYGGVVNCNSEGGVEYNWAQLKKHLKELMPGQRIRVRSVGTPDEMSTWIQFTPKEVKNGLVACVEETLLEDEKKFDIRHTGGEYYSVRRIY